MPDGLILVILDKNYVILDKDLTKEVSNIDVKKLDSCVLFLRCFSDTVNKEDFILAIAGRSQKYKHSYKGDQPGFASWLSKVYFDLQSKQLKLRDPDHNSLMINKNEVKSILEFMPDRLLLHINPSDLLVVIGWQMIRRIVEIDQGNSQKF